MIECSELLSDERANLHSRVQDNGCLKLLVVGVTLVCAYLRVPILDTVSFVAYGRWRFIDLLRCWRTAASLQKTFKVSCPVSL